MSRPSNARVREYWDVHIHDLGISSHPPGSPEFFRDLDDYHFEKLHHLLRLVDFAAYGGRRVLDVGCGAGVDLARFVRGGAQGTGVDLARSAVRLARANFSQQQLHGTFVQADGEQLPFAPGTFDVVYAHGVVQYTSNGQALVEDGDLHGPARASCDHALAAAQVAGSTVIPASLLRRTSLPA